MKTSTQLEQERKAIEIIMNRKYPKGKESDICYKIISGEIKTEIILKGVN